MDLKNYLIEIRRKIHEHPELGFEEYETQKLIINELEKFGFNYKKIRTGVVAEIGKGSDEKILAFRADMDALPITEETNKPYASKIPGKMHACGHDSHVAILLGFAMEISKFKNKIPGKIQLIFQPNEEGAGGAHAMIDGGCLEPKPDMIFALHVSICVPSGCVGFKYGPLMAAVDKVKIFLKGPGGHAAMPDQTSDIVLAGANLVQALHTIVSRDISPADAGVLTFGKIKAGEEFNIIPTELELLGTIRSFTKKTRETIIKRINEISENYSKAFRVEAKVEIENMNQALLNDKNSLEFIKKSAEKILGEKNVIILDEPGMSGEDFADYLDYVPGCFFYLGIKNEAKGAVYTWHNPKFDIDEEIMPLGVNIFLDAAKNYFNLE